MKNKNIISRVINFIKNLMADSLYSNSIYLIASTAVMSIIGFFSWIIIARLFSPHEIGLATSLISISALIANLSLLGLNVGIIRYLPKAENKNGYINTSIIIVTITSIIASVIYLIGFDFFSPKLAFVKENLLLTILFVFFVIVFCLDLIMESTFIAFRKTSYVLIKNSLISASKLVLPILLTGLAFYGIFLAIAVGTTIAVSFSIYILIKKLHYLFIPKINGNLIKKVAKFSFGNYIAASLTQLPNLILPVMITNMINPNIAAFYYISMMIANFLYVIPSATAESLFAEGSHDTKSLRTQSLRATKIIFAISIPAMLGIILFGKIILNFFGNEYVTYGYPFLIILTISTVFLAMTRILSTILKVHHKIKELIFSYIMSTLAILGFSYLFISLNFGLIGIGYAWLIGKFILALGLFISIIYDKPKQYVQIYLSYELNKISNKYLKKADK